MTFSLMLVSTLAVIANVVADTSHDEQEEESGAQMDKAIASLISTYHEVNAAVVDELREEPSPLEFMRYVARNRPFVVRKAAAYWKATERWDARYLLDKMEGEEVRVAVTPHGCVDSTSTSTL